MFAALLPLVACTWILANFFASNLDELGGYDPSEIGETILIAYAAVILMMLPAGLLRLMSSRWCERYLFALAIVIPLLFSHEVVASLIAGWASAVAYVTPWASLAALVGIAILAFHAARYELFRRATWIFFGAALVIPLIQLGSAAAQTLAAADIPDPTDKKADEFAGLVLEHSRISTENVYYFVFDSYPGEEVARKILGFSNEELIRMMDENGFFNSGDFLSNYFETYLTFTAILSGNYPAKETSPVPDRALFYPRILKSGYRLDAVNAFKTMGYKAHFVGNWYARCEGETFECWPQEKFVISRMLSVFLSPTPYPLLVSYVDDDPAPSVAAPAWDRDWDITRPVLESLPAIKRRDHRLFVFGHNFPPHPPTIYDENCDYRAHGVASYITWGVRRATYLDNVKCVNRKITALVKGLIEEDPDAIIVIQSDHGSYTALKGHFTAKNLTDELRFEVSKPINFVRAPAECRQWLYKGMSQVNTMRFVLGCVQRVKPKYVDDLSFESRPGATPHFVRFHGVSPPRSIDLELPLDPDFRKGG